MTMSKKDYQVLARAIYEARIRVEAPPNNVRFNTSDGLVALGHVQESITGALAADNPRFDRARFVEACETGTCKGMKKTG